MTSTAIITVLAVISTAAWFGLLAGCLTNCIVRWAASLKDQ